MEKEEIRKVKKLMEKEPAFLKLKGKIMVAGDTHGDVIISKQIVKKFFDDNFDYLIFLGDYIDRAPPDVGSSLPNIDFLLRKKLEYPNKIYLLKGNHESNYAIPCYPYEFGYEAKDLHDEYVNVFREMPLAALLNNVFASHGGIYLGKIDKNNLEAIEALTWSDPVIANLYRGAGFPFNSEDLEKFLKKIKAEAFIRGHDYNLNGIVVYKKCLTIFSSRLYKDMGNKGILIAKIYGDINSIDDIEIEDFYSGKWEKYKVKVISD